MFRKIIQFQALHRYLKEIGFEWVSFPLIEQSEQFIRKARQDGSVQIEGERYTEEELQRLQLESTGRVHTVSLCTGGIEGYKLFIRTESGQVIVAKFFDESLCMKVMEWLHSL